nr:GTP-binding protein [Actinoalloteichus spitiensis]
MPGAPRPTLLVLAGYAAEEVERLAAELVDGTTAVVHHDLALITEGVVRRRLRIGPRDETRVLELAHGCVSCTLREDLLPLVRRLALDDTVSRVVLHLDPTLEPEAVCWALRHVVVEDGPVLDHVDLLGVTTVVDEGSWLSDATGDRELVEDGRAGSADDERTVAQVVTAQAEFADLLLLTGQATDAWTGYRTRAVLDRLAPRSRRVAREADLWAELAALPPTARRGEVDDAHAPLLRGQPPVEPDAGVELVLFSARRPFHPERLHDALDVLLDGVVRSRGRVWVATQPDVALWLESAGGGLRVGHAGPWLAAADGEAWGSVDAERAAIAAARWHHRYGDRHQELVVLTHRASAGEITAALREALLTEDELALGPAGWRRFDDPFGSWHTEPCEDGAQERDAGVETTKGLDEQ